MSYKHVLVSHSPSASEGKVTVTELAGAESEDDGGVRGDNAESVPDPNRRATVPARRLVHGTVHG
eukprot:5083191-Pyramimonas_sp.AAC.1